MRCGGADVHMAERTPDRLVRGMQFTGEWAAFVRAAVFSSYGYRWNMLEQNVNPTMLTHSLRIGMVHNLLTRC